MSNVIQLQPIESSNIESAGHDGTTLEVKFRGSGKRYQYKGVTPELFNEFMKAPSKGSFFAKNIRTCHECVPIIEAPPPERAS